MRSALLTCLLLIDSLCKAQNLVPNPSFEEYSSCPNGIGQIDLTNSWSSARETPDYYNACSISSSTGVPTNYYGYQYPASGVAYCGLMMRSPDDTWCESISTELLEELEIGKTYYLSFKVSLAECTNPSLQGNICGINKIGALLSVGQYDSDLSPVKRCSTDCSQVYSSSVISETTHWVCIKGYFTADSAYKYFNIGRFNYNNTTDTIQLVGLNCNSYYYIDDVCLSEDSNFAYSYQYTPVSSTSDDALYRVYPTIASDNLLIESSLYVTNATVALYDMEMKEHYSSRLINTIEHIPIVGLPHGLYLIKIFTGQNTFYYKILKTAK